MLKIYACFSESHAPFVYKHFLPSIPPGLRVVLHKIPQDCPGGSFRSEKWGDMAVHKFKMCIDACNDPEADLVYVSDVDARFYAFSAGILEQDLSECLGSADIAFQWDGEGKFCSGSWVAKPDVRLSQMFQHAIELLPEFKGYDQPAMNKALEAAAGIVSRRLPVRYWSHGAYNSKHWEPGDALQVPSSIMVHQANWCIGIDKKLALLAEVKGMVDNFRAAGDAAKWAVTITNDTGFLHDAVRYSCKVPLVYETPDDGKRVRAQQIIEAGGVPVLDIEDPDVLDKAVLGPPVEDAGSHRCMPDEARPRKPILASEMLGEPGDPLSYVPPPPKPEGPRLCRSPMAEAVERAEGHEPNAPALVLQIWEHDKREAEETMRLIADIEPKPRKDVLFVLAAQEGTIIDAGLEKALEYIGHKFSYMQITTKVDNRKKYPGVCFDPWASAVEQLATMQARGDLRSPSAFFFEPDGCPAHRDWIDWLTAAHNDNVAKGRWFTGAVMEGNYFDRHMNGSLIMYLPAWRNLPSLHTCPDDQAWDIWHGATILANGADTRHIVNEHGLSYTAESFEKMGRQAAWFSSNKDRTAHFWARRLLVKS